MKKFVLLFGIAALGLMASCENTIRYEYDRNDGQITMLSQMYTSDTEHTVYLSMSYPDRVDSLPGATVVCWVNGEKYVAEEQPVPMEACQPRLQALMPFAIRGSGTPSIRRTTSIW